MPVEGVDTFSRLRVPHLECAVGGAADDDVVPHLGRPHAARVPHQGPQTLEGERNGGGKHTPTTSINKTTLGKILDANMAFP